MKKYLSFFMCAYVCMFAVSRDCRAEEDVQNNQLETYYELIKNAGWDQEDEESERKKIFDEIESLLNVDSKTLSDLKDNAQAMKEKEQSLENKILGATGMATMGIGGMQLASGLAEKKADEEAETAMRAYLATFTCEYGSGRFAGGESAIELPGANILTPLVMEYKALAADLKVRKAALGMQPGIESEEIIDAATAGLYDDENVGKTGGAYTSLSRALSGDETAAAEWNAQKEESAKQVKTGAIVAGVGGAASLVGNLALNKNAPKESSKDILSRRQDAQNRLNALIKQTLDECNAEISNNLSLIEEIKANSGWQNDETLVKYVKAIEGTKTLSADTDITEIKEHPICR